MKEKNKESNMIVGIPHVIWQANNIEIIIAISNSIYAFGFIDFRWKRKKKLIDKISVTTF